MEVVWRICPIGHQAAVFNILPLGVDGGKARRVDKRDDVPSVVPEHPVSDDNYPVGAHKDGWPEPEQVFGASRRDLDDTQLTYPSRTFLGRIEFRYCRRTVGVEKDRYR